MRRGTACLLACLGFALAAGIAGAESVAVLRDGDIAGWEEKVFEGRTVYETVRHNGRTVVRATSRGTASGLYLRRRIDLDETPILRWTWRVDGTLGDIDERTRAGRRLQRPGLRHSLASCVPVAHPGRELRVGGHAGQGRDVVERPYTDASRHVAVRSGDAHVGEWVGERRDVQADFLELFGESVRYVDAVAIMTDTDNTGRRCRGVLRRHHLLA